MIYFANGRGEITSYCKDTTEAVLADIRNSYDVIELIKSAVDALVEDKSNAGGYPTVLGDWERYGNFQIDIRRYVPIVSSVRYNDSLQLVSKLASFRLINETFAYKCSGDSVSIGDTYVSVNTDNINKSNVYGNFTLKTVVDGTDCASCGMVILSSDAPTHPRTYQCQIEAGKRQVSDDMVKIKMGGQLATFIRNTPQIPSVMIPEMFGVYVPTWVYEAIRMYQANGNQYSDLTIEEYLIKTCVTDNAQ